MTIDEIIAKIREVSNGVNFPLIVLTGGEPSLFADYSFICAIRKEFDVKIAMESNGTQTPPSVDFLTISPKEPYVGKVGYPVVRSCSEVKIVYDCKIDPEQVLLNNGAPMRATHGYYLQPLDTGNEEQNRKIIKATVEYCMKNPRWRISLQTHKILNLR